MSSNSNKKLINDDKNTDHKYLTNGVTNNVNTATTHKVDKVVVNTGGNNTPCETPTSLGGTFRAKIGRLDTDIQDTYDNNMNKDRMYSTTQIRYEDKKRGRYASKGSQRIVNQR